jgi:arylsulfatase A-like enzyme
MIEAMDQGVGEILDKLGQLGLEENTLIFFFSDNGPTGPGTTGGLRGKKGTTWEGGHRVPGAAWWPGKIPAHSISHETVLTMDIFPTLAALAGISVSGLDGIDLTPLLLNNSNLEERTLFWKYKDDFAVRSGPWKLRVNANDNSFLFNLNEDVNEQDDIAQAQQDMVNTLRTELEAWRTSLSNSEKVEYEVTGLREIHPEKKKIYIKGNHFISIPIPGSGPVSAVLYDLNGRILKRIPLQQLESIDFVGLQRGIFILRITQGNYKTQFKIQNSMQ